MFNIQSSGHNMTPSEWYTDRVPYALYSTALLTIYMYKQTFFLFMVIIEYSVIKRDPNGLFHTC